MLTSDLQVAAVVLDVLDAGGEVRRATLDASHGSIAVTDALGRSVLLEGWRFPSEDPATWHTAVYVPAD